MISKYIQEGNKIELESVKRSVNEFGEIVRKTYKSELYEIVSEDRVRIAMPVEKMKVILLPVDAQYSMCFYTKNGLYQCMARVAERYRNKNLFVLVMDLETDLQRYQRREYYRLNTILDMKSKKLDDDIEKDENDSTEKVEFMNTDLTFDNGTMVDISGGGARFISSVQYQEGSLIRFVFSLFVNGNMTEYNLVGRVLMSELLMNRNDAYENRIQFVNIGNEDRESIIKYIFEEERKKRNRDRR